MKQRSQSRVLVRPRRHANRPPQPNNLPANVESPDDVLDELRSCMAFECDTKNCKIVVFMEIGLDFSIFCSAIVPEGVHSPHNFTRDLGKTKDGGVRFISA